MKDKDQLKPKQLATFKKIRDVLGCQVRIARINPVPGARPGDGLLSQWPANKRPTARVLESGAPLAAERHVVRQLWTITYRLALYPSTGHLGRSRRDVWLNAPYKLKGYERWVVTSQMPGRPPSEHMLDGPVVAPA